MHTSPAIQHPVFTVCGLPPDAAFIETHDGYAVVDRNATPTSDAVLLVTFCGRQYYARMCGDAIITEDGEAIEGDALDDLQYIGVVTHRISSASFDDGVI